MQFQRKPLATVHKNVVHNRCSPAALFTRVHGVVCTQPENWRSPCADGVHHRQCSPSQTKELSNLLSISCLSYATPLVRNPVSRTQGDTMAERDHRWQKPPTYPPKTSNVSPSTRHSSNRPKVKCCQRAQQASQATPPPNIIGSHALQREAVDAK